MGFLNNPHLQTIAAAFFRPGARLDLVRKTIETPDGDFLDLDFYEANECKKIAILVHGLEGSYQDNYITRTMKVLAAAGMNSVCMNLRSCSGRLNNKVYSYHSGKSEDLKTAIDSVDLSYESLYLIGFSIGGNMTLKYLGEGDIDSRIKQAFSISAPVDLESSAQALAQKSTKIYMDNLLQNLKKKVFAKAKLFPGEISAENFNEVKNFYDFDGRYTAPLNGFSSAQDYWSKASSKPFLEEIQIPTSIITALDDPFLGPECFVKPQNKMITTHYSDFGGHLAFMDFRKLPVKFLYEKIILGEIQ